MKHPSKQKLVCILLLLQKHSDESNPLTAERIGQLLDEEYGITAERKSIRRDIQVLSDMDLVEDAFSAGTSPDMRGSYYIDRPFEDWQLKLLTDAVNHAMFLTDKDAGELTDSILSLAGPSSRRLIENNMQKHVASRADRFRYILDALLNAIKDEKQISFKYFDLNEEGKKVFRKNGRRYTVNPYHVFWVDRNYYMICNTHGKDDLGAYRLDRMDDVIKSDKPRTPASRLPKGDLTQRAANFPAENANRFMGDALPIEIRCRPKWLGTVRDVFGYNNVSKIRGSKDSYKVLTVDSEGLYISLMQLGSRIEVTGPDRVRQTLKEKLEELLAIYN